MIAPSKPGNNVYSSEVRLTVELGEQTHSISAVGPDRFVLAEPQQLGACDAVLVISVNGEPRRVPIRVLASEAPVREFVYSVR